VIELRELTADDWPLWRELRLAALEEAPYAFGSHESGVVELISMWIAPAGRGRGIGDQLMAAVERSARDQAAHTLQLSVADGNDRAHALYLRSGFTDTDIEGELMPDGIHREIVMRKAL
jgi:ribosomal protein S18 acetylase RimI-like enzyme